MDSEREARGPFQVDIGIIRSILVFSASFLFSEARSHEDRFATHEYVLAILLFNLSLLLPSKMLTPPSAKLPRWRSIPTAFVGIFYYLFIPASLSGTLRQQANALSDEYEKNCMSWSAFRLFVLVLTAFTAVIRSNRLIHYFKGARKVVPSPADGKKDN